MEIIGERKPVANRKYKYSFKIGVDKYAPARWKVFDINDKDFKKVLYENTNGLFCFQSTDIGKEFILKAYVEIYNTQEVYKTKLAILSDQMKILSVEWRDVNNKPINGRTVGYLDDITLAIKTLYIPIGDTLSVTIYEDEAIGSPRCMGTYKTTPINKEGYTELHLKKEMLKLYQQRLNNADLFDESEHEYYVQIVYRDHINRVEEGIQLKIKNVLDAFIKPKVAVKPVLVNVPDPPEKEMKKGKDLFFNMFFDGTMNNKDNTEAKINYEKSVFNGTIRERTIFDIRKEDKYKNNDSYQNFYSNIALLYKTLIDTKNNNIFNIYTEGIGTEKGKEDSVMVGGGIGLGSTGVVAKVKKALNEMRNKMNLYEGSIGTIYINVFGFSRGAAAARNFISQRKEIASKLKLENEYKIYFNFVGLFDTVASYGVYHQNDVKELSLDIKGNAKKVIHLVAADEYRENFKLTNIESSIKAGVGYELSLPGVHSDIGGGYKEKEDEKRWLGSNISIKDLGEDPNCFDNVKQYYKNEGWYNTEDFKIEKKQILNTVQQGVTVVAYQYSIAAYQYNLYGVRKSLSNNYQYIALKIMVYFCNKYSSKLIFDKDKMIKYVITKEKDEFLYRIQEQILKYAKENDGINSIKVQLSKEDLHKLRHQYLHRSNQDDDMIAMYGRYKEGKPKRDILQG